MIIGRIRCIEMPVSNMEKAVSFYEKMLKLKKTYDHPVWTAFDVGGVTFALAASGTKPGGKGRKLCTSCSPCVFRYAMDKKKLGKVESGVSSVVYFQCDDLDSVYKRLIEGGVRFIAEPKDQGWGGRTAVMFDPDNNIIVLSEVEKRPKQVIECKPAEALMDLSKNRS